LAAMGLVLAPWVLLLRRRERNAAAAPPPALAKMQLGMTLFVVALVNAVQAGQWAVSGYVGELAHMPAARIGLYLALSSIAGFAGALVPSLTRDPAYRLGFVLLGFVVMAAAVLVFFNWRDDMAFLWSQIALNVGYYMVTPFVIGLLTENDRDGALVLRTLVIALVGAALGTALAGGMFTGSGPLVFSVTCAALIGIGMVSAAMVFKRLPRMPAVLNPG
jgi:DHA1 family inner membrane transport protein